MSHHFVFHTARLSQNDTQRVLTLAMKFTAAGVNFLLPGWFGISFPTRHRYFRQSLFMAFQNAASPEADLEGREKLRPVITHRDIVFQLPVLPG